MSIRSGVVAELSVPTCSFTHSLPQQGVQRNRAIHQFLNRSCLFSSITSKIQRPFVRQKHHVSRSSPVPVSLAERDHLQLATAKLPGDIDVATFGSKLYQWASTLTFTGRNMPFALPFRTNPLETGFELSLLRINQAGRPVSIGDIVATVEPEPGVGNVLFVRFYDTPDSGMDRRTPLPADQWKRLRAAADACVDIPVLMNSLPAAIKSAVTQSRQ